MDGKKIQHFVKPKESVAKVKSNEKMKSANISIKEMETVGKYLFNNYEESHVIINIFSKIDAILILGAVLAIVISCIMVTIEIRNYKLYQMAKNKPVRLVLTRELLERIRIQRYKAMEHIFHQDSPGVTICLNIQDALPLDLILLDLLKYDRMTELAKY
uniref:PIG-H domain-containing protein n=1 Tax=Elaeophora elaphi TaxID=1147741 RepID=A0A0R3RMZ0_9BILA